MSKYPVIQSGRRLTAAFLASMQEDKIYKTANQDIASDATLGDDSELTTTLAASAVYFVEMHIHYATPTAAGFQTAWTVPTGATGNRWTLGGGSTQVTSDNVPGRFTVIAFASSASYADRASSTNQLGLMESAIVITSSAGTLAFQWAQDASTAANTRVAAGSFMIVKRIA